MADPHKAAIFEGIETAQHLKWARASGADYVQGFLYRDLFKSYAPGP